MLHYLNLLQQLVQVLMSLIPMVPQPTYFMMAIGPKQNPQ